VLTARNNLRTAGSACETEDRSDASLLSAGWSLRRIPGPPQPVPVPARLLLENTRFPAQVRARWTRVKNARFYEVKAATTGENPDPSIWDTLPAVLCPSLRWSSAQELFLRLSAAVAEQSKGNSWNSGRIRQLDQMHLEFGMNDGEIVSLPGWPDKAKVELRRLPMAVILRCALKQIGFHFDDRGRLFLLRPFRTKTGHELSRADGKEWGRVGGSVPDLGAGVVFFFLWLCLLFLSFVIRLIFLFPGSGTVLWRRCGSIRC
jgi:hypothetical protein